MNHHTIALAALIGMGFDVLGGSFLAYDLLGQRQKPLRFLLRVVLYSAIFSTAFGLAFGIAMGLVAGIGLGLALAFELTHPAIEGPSEVRGRLMTGLAAFRACCVGIGLGLTFSWRLCIWYVPLAFLALRGAYAIGFAPMDEKEQPGGMHLSRHKAAGAFVRALLLFLATIVATFVTRDGHISIILSLKIGFVVALVGLLASTLSPPIEGATDAMPERTLGYLGLGLIGLGTLLQSVQYWVSLLDIPVR